MQSYCHYLGCSTCPDQSLQGPLASIHGPGALFQPVFWLPLLSWEILASAVLTCWLYSWVDQTSPCLKIAGLPAEPIPVIIPALLESGGAGPCWCSHSWLFGPWGTALLLLSPDTLCSAIIILIPIPSHFILVWGQWSVQVHKKFKVSCLLWSCVCKPSTSIPLT